jgi:hypothetical protein
MRRPGHYPRYAMFIAKKNYLFRIMLNPIKHRAHIPSKFRYGHFDHFNLVWVIKLYCQYNLII